MINKSSKSVLAMFITAIMIAAAFTSLRAGTSGDDVTVIKLPSMQCGSCKKKITKSLQKLDGVKSVDVNLETKEAKVTFDNSSVNLSQLEGAITAAGYDANDKKADPSAYENLDECCKVPKDK